MREAVKLHMVCLSSYNDRQHVPMIDFRLQRYQQITYVLINAGHAVANKFAVLWKDKYIMTMWVIII
jgi:hypothetical protein